MSLNWRNTALSRPANPTDPGDPAYRWPREIDTAVRRAERHGIAVTLMVIWTPGWANGGQAGNWAPNSVDDLADFLAAASRRYPRVRRWMIWGEPTRHHNFMPLEPQTTGVRLTAQQARAPRKYARMLDAGYGALKQVNRRNVVIGGNSFSTGNITTRNWIRYMRLRDGGRPRMDMYGHNPYTIRPPDLSLPLGSRRLGVADFSDLDSVMRWLDRFGYRDGRGRRLRLFLSEFSWPTDNLSYETNYYVKRKLQARWTAAALRVVRRTPRIATLGWFQLLDEPPRPDNLELNRGLLDYKGEPKPAFFAFRDG
jgi:hypothetical protein